MFISYKTHNDQRNPQRIDVLISSGVNKVHLTLYMSKSFGILKYLLLFSAKIDMT